MPIDYAYLHAPGLLSVPRIYWAVDAGLVGYGTCIGRTA